MGKKRQLSYTLEKNVYNINTIDKAFRKLEKHKNMSTTEDDIH